MRQVDPSASPRPDRSTAFAHLPAKGNQQLMLPGLRFLCAAVVLSMSLLVFGFGATALFRSARQDVASLPVLRAPPETVFAQPEPQPRLAMLQVEPPAADSDAAVTSSPAAPPTDQVPSALPALTETDRTATPEKLSALSPTPEAAAAAEAPQPQVLLQVLPEAAKPDAPAPIEVAKLEIVPAAAPAIVAPAPPPPAAEPPALVATEPVTPVAAAPAPAIQPSPTEPNQVSTTVATLGGPAVTIAPIIAAKPVVVAPKPKKTVRERTVKRKRVAARAERAEPQQAANPFAPPFR